ncbi:MAG: antitoxin component YwqK of YwqJK toxin-antitoxin module [Sulfurimonas sp.]|jgi:antitoxin component YwqK of YwqJK toxin-antitoxin module|uniref:toxin-antitoxin system YwqK family antitoxin n=1 Tax=Sulfurimonas sp. TaxID=2022749 RepID=UPI0039E53ECE
MKLILFITLTATLLAENILKPYTEDGKILQIAVSTFEKNNVDKKTLLSGSKKYYYNTGELHLEYNYIKKDEIIVKKYYKSGQIYLISTYIADIKNGLSKVYYEDGILAATVSYSQDKMDGRYDEYYTNGTLHYQKYFTNGMLDGPILVYDTVGNKSYQLDYENVREVCY